MSTLRQAAQQALEALEWSWGGEPMGTLERDAITALRAALAEPERKPLTDEEIAIISVACAATHRHDDWSFTRAIERAHGIKEQET